MREKPIGSHFFLKSGKPVYMSSAPFPISDRSVLVVSYRYPPYWNTGTVRISKMVKYLKRMGWAVTLITPRRLFQGGLPLVEEDEYRPNRLIKTLFPLTDIYEASIRLFKWVIRKMKFWRRASTDAQKPSVLIRENPYRIRWFQRLESFFFPIDLQILWLPCAFVYGFFCCLFRPHIKYLLVSGPPFSQLLIGSWLKLFFRRLKFVADFRDHWSDDPCNFYPTPFHKFAIHWAERYVYKTANALVFVSEFNLQRCLEKGPWAGKSTLIYNGFDQEDFSHQTFSFASKVMTLNHFGNLSNGRDIQGFVGSLSELLRDGRIPRGKIQCRFYGSVDDIILSQIESFNLGDVVQFYPSLPYKIALKGMQESFALLLILEESHFTRAYPTKFFEYLYAKRPIFFLW